MKATMKIGVLAFLLLVNGTMTNSAFAEDDACMESVSTDDFPSRIDIDTKYDQYTSYFRIGTAKSLINIKLHAYLDGRVENPGKYCVELYSKAKGGCGGNDEPARLSKCATLGEELFHSWSGLGIGIYRIKIWKNDNGFSMKGNGTAEKF